MAVACDLLDDAALDAVVPEVVERLGPPTVLVNAAGAIVGGNRAEDEPLDAVRRTLELNLVVPFRLSQAVFPHLVAAGGGAIVHIFLDQRARGPGIPRRRARPARWGCPGSPAVSWPCSGPGIASA